ncbi:MAG: glycosyltransferase family 39 protein [Vicinamibacterales bacterium]
MSRARLTPQTSTLILITAGALLRIVAADAIGLGVSESYYYGAAMHPALSYFDQPPAAAWIGWLVLQVAPEGSSLALRLPFIACFAATTWLMFTTARMLFGPWAGFLSALMLNLTPVFALSAGLFFQPDGPLMCFWLAVVHLLARVMLREPAHEATRRYWMLAGVSLGLALLSKYSAIFLLGGTAMWMSVRRDARAWLRRPDPYLALVAAAAVFAPVLWWNAQHEWLSFIWQGGRATAYKGLHVSWLLQNLGGQLLEVSPWIWLLVLLEVPRAFRRHDAHSTARRFLVVIALPPVVVFTAVAAYADVGNHFHWGTPGYLTLLVSLGATLHEGWQRRPRVMTATIVLMAAASTTIMILPTIQAATGVFSRGTGVIATILAGDHDPTIELVDYDALVPALERHGLRDRPDVFVFSDRHHVAGKVDYALRGRAPFMVFGQDPRAYAFFDTPAAHIGHDGILVSHRPSLDELRWEYGSYCGTFEAIDAVPVLRADVPVVTLYLYRCAPLTVPYPLPYGRAPEPPGLPLPQH